MYQSAIRRFVQHMCQPCITGHHISNGIYEGCKSQLCPCTCNDEGVRLIRNQPLGLRVIHAAPPQELQAA